VALSNLFTGPSRIRPFGPTVTGPIFDAGRNQATLQPVEAPHRETLLRDEQAFREVTDALVARRRAWAALTEQDAAGLASREALAIAELSCTSGLASSLNVLDAQRTLRAAEVARNRTLGAQPVAVVPLYPALGGG
jgi:multidrug efflux system outer membrane protein